MVIYVRYANYVFDVRSNVLNLSLKVVEVRFASLDVAVIEVLIALMTDHKFEDDSSEEIH